MTRNNLGDHLAWLLRCIDLSTPLGPELPHATDPLDSPNTLFPVSSQDVQAGTHSSASSFLDPDPSPADLEVALITNAGAANTSESQGITEGSGEIDTMAKLTSSTKSKKPGLVVAQRQSSKPASSPSVGRLQKAYSASLHTADVLAQPRDTKSTPANSSKRRKRRSLASIVDISESDDDDLEALDLTADDNADSSSIAFGDSDFIDGQGFLSGPDPVSRHSKKRKSNEITTNSDEGHGEEEDEFPDIFDIVPEQKTPASIRRPAPSSTRPSTIKRRTPMTKNDVLEQHMVTQTISRTETRIRRANDAENYPSSMSTLSLGTSSKAVPQRDSTPRRVKKNTLSSSPLPKNEGTDDQTQLSQEPKQARKARRSDIIQDSDDEFVTPPTHHVSFATCASDSRTKFESHSPMLDMGQSSSAEGAFLIHTPSKQRSAIPKAQVLPSEKVSQIVEDDMEIDQLEESLQPPEEEDDMPSSAEPIESTMLVNKFLENPTAVEEQRKSVLDQIRDNAKTYLKAIETGMSTAARERIKGEKAPMAARLKAFDVLLEAHLAHQRLVEQQKEILERIAFAYGDDLDTTEDENQMEVLREAISISRKTLGQELMAAGIDNTVFQDAEDAANKLQQSSRVVQATQAPEPRVASSSTRTSALIPECASQIILQTQVPAEQSRRSTVRQTFAPPAAEYTSMPKNEGTSKRPQYEQDEDLFLDDDDIFPELEEPPSRHYNDVSAKTLTSAVQGSLSKPVVPRVSEPFSDYDDDMDFHNMLALAEDFDRRQTSPESALKKSSTTVFTETSGNAGITARCTGSIKRDAALASKTTIPKESKKFTWSSDVRRALKDRFRMTGFRHNQLEAINATLDGKDAFVLMPTGGGKSLCYQLPAVINSGKTRGVTIVISPLISLMQDQVDHLNALNIIAKPFNGEMKKPAKDMILGAFKERNPEHFVQLLYVTPEMVNKSGAFCSGLMSLHQNKKLARIVIDEAHCVSQWGHDFRPDYKALGEFRQKFPNVPVMALTATATQNVIADIKHNLAMDGCQVFSQSFNRPNLYYEIRAKDKTVVNSIAELINSRYRNQTGIVYTLSRRSAEKIAQTLKEQHNINAHHYHASIEPVEKARIQRDWQKGAIKVVVATIAFGMGIDKPDVRFVVHHHLPKSLEGYYQETGRAGRDGKPSDCILFFSYGDIATLRSFIDDGEGNAQQKERQREMLDKVISFCESKHECRRVEILRYFGEAFSRDECNKTCDNCKVGGTFELQDFSQYAKGVLEVIRLHGRMTLAQCTEILLGKKKPENDEAAPYHGIARTLKKSDVNSIIFKLAAESALNEENTINRKFGMAITYFVVGRASRDFVSGRRRLQIMAKVGGAKNAAPKQTKKRTKRTQSDAADAADIQDAPQVRRPPPSTNVSSPIRKRKKARVNQFIDDEATDDDDQGLDSAEEANGPLHTNGYEKDNFVVSDEEDDEDEHFNPVRYVPRQRQRTLEELGPPISRDTAFTEANIPDIHQDIIHHFLPEAKELEEKIRNSRGLQRILFTEQHLRQMAIRWTTTLDKMRQIPGINVSNVDKYGSKLVPLVKQYDAQYKEMMGESINDEPRRVTRPPPARQIPGPVRPDIVDLLSSDEDGFDEEEEDDDDEEEEEEEEDLESSRYFGQGGTSGSGAPSREVERWHEKFAQLSQQPSATNAAKKAKRPFSRKTPVGRGGFARGRSSGGVTKRKASSGGYRRASGGSSKAKASKGGAGRGASSGIGLMPM